MAVCVCDRNYESHLVQPANGNTKWYPVSQQCKRAKKEKKRKGSIYLLAAMTWELEESDGADKVVVVVKASTSPRRLSARQSESLPRTCTT
jgi:hypothetical protein